MNRYIIVTADSIEQLEKETRYYLAKGWMCQGGPFTSSYASGHGPVIAGPPGYSTGFDGWIYQQFHQAITMVED
jgi:hypothetical protein